MKRALALAATASIATDSAAAAAAFGVRVGWRSVALRGDDELSAPAEEPPER